ncbi:MAG: FAD-dependent oxidoreductase, partial [Alphaproteobacteria bacterium]
MENGSRLRKIFEPYQAGRLSLKNRIVMPAMGTMYGAEDGCVTQRLKDYYEERAKGGMGLVIVEMACVDAPVGRMGGRQLIINDDRYLPGLRELAQVIRDQETKVMIQLCHAGRMARSSITGVPPVAPSAILAGKQETPKELTVGEIENIVTHFSEAALRAQKAGFDGVEVHAAHGYLLAEFISSAWNKRQDHYGGSLRNRARILTEIIARTKDRVGPSYPVWCRINGKEYGIEGGVTLDEAKEVALMAQEAGVDAIHVSAYGYGSCAGINRAAMGHPRGNLVSLAEEIKKVVGVPVIAVGRMDPRTGEESLLRKKADLIAIGRPFIADPRLIKKTVEGKLDEIRPCLGCNVCADDMIAADTSVHCSVNAVVGREKEFELMRAQKTKKVLVVGGGPAGMEAAAVACLRGHQVVLYEKQLRLGGQLNLAVKPPHKDEIQSFTNYLITRVKKLGIEVQLGKEVDADTIGTVKPDSIILATGSTPFKPEIPGIDRDHVILAEDVLSGKGVGKRVLIIGGGLVG